MDDLLSLSDHLRTQSRRSYIQYFRDMGISTIQAKDIYFMLYDLSRMHGCSLEVLHILYGNVYQRGYLTHRVGDEISKILFCPKTYFLGEISKEMFHGILQALNSEAPRRVNREEMAERMNGRLYGDEMSEADIQLAKDSGLVVLFSRVDMLYMRGALNAELELGRSLDVSIDKETGNGMGELYHPFKEDQPKNWLRCQHFHDFGPGESIIGYVRVNAKVAEAMKTRYYRITPVHMIHSVFMTYDGPDVASIGCVIEAKYLTW